jgi:2-dehydropantoate 2-reductase
MADRIYVVGAGSIGMPLAAFLSAKGAPVTAVRTHIDGIAPTTIEVTVDLPDRTLSSQVETVSLSEIINAENGIVVLTAKATANKILAAKMKDRFSMLPLIILQNGLGVEKPFLDAGFSDVYRGVLYATGQTTEKYSYRFREVAESPLGTVNGSSERLQVFIEQLSTPDFRFCCDENIQKQAWKKSIINAAFNSICPLINADNGIFHRDPAVTAIAETIIREAGSVAEQTGIRFENGELLNQLLLISRRSDGQLISTLQDLNSGRETEIDFLNMEIARIGASLNPPIDTPVTRTLGEMIRTKSNALR